MAQEMFESCRDPLALPQPNREIQTLRVGYREGRVKSMRNLTHDTYELVVQCDIDQKQIGEAGQFWTIRIRACASRVRIPSPVLRSRRTRESIRSTSVWCRGANCPPGWREETAPGRR